MYCRMQRILFYAIAVFTFCFRFHSWLTASGVAYLTATSVVMTIHSLALQCGTDIVPDCNSALSILLLFISGVTARTFLSFSPRVLRYRMKTAFVTTVALHVIYCVLCAYHFNKKDQKHRRHRAVKVCTSHGGCYDTCSTRVPGSYLRSNHETGGVITTSRQLDITDKVSMPFSNIMNIASELTTKLGNDYHQTPNDYPISVNVSWNCLLLVGCAGTWLMKGFNSPSRFRNGFSLGHDKTPTFIVSREHS